MRMKNETLDTVFDMVYVALMTNLMLAVSCLPLIAWLVTCDPARSWPLIVFMGPVCAPGVCATFAVLAAFTGEHRTTVAQSGVVRTFATAWRASLRRAAALGILAAAALVVLAVDVRAAWGRPVGAAAIPLLVTAMVLVASTSLLALVVLAERPTVRLRHALRAGLYLGLRHWYLTAFSLAVLAVFESLVASRPAIALGLAAAPLLYVVWANSRFTLREALGHSPG